MAWCEAQWDTKCSNSIWPLRQKVSQEFCCAQHTHFILFKKTIATFEFEVMAPLGNNWGLSRILFDGQSLATIAGLHPLSHFSALPGCCWYFGDLNVFHFLFFYNGSPLITVVTRWSHHLLLGRLREWDSLCCSFGTGLSDGEDDPLTFHHLFRALKINALDTQFIRPQLFS